MDLRILFTVVLGLIVVAGGGFYFALRPSLNDTVLPPLPPAQTSAQSSVTAPSTAAEPSPQPAPAPAPPPMATAASVEAEIDASEYAELQALLKKNFASEYGELIAKAVARRNEGVSDAVFAQELADRFQEIMRGKLKFGVGATMPTIDKLAANEASLFHALGTEGAAFCMKMLGRDDAPAAGPQPANVRELMRIGTLYRFQAIVEGMPTARPVEALSAEEMRGFEASLAREGLNFRDVSTGAYLNKGAAEPGRPCLTLETLHLAIARLPDASRRKIYAGMFFLGRDR